MLLAGEWLPWAQHRELPARKVVGRPRVENSLERTRAMEQTQIFGCVFFGNPFLVDLKRRPKGNQPFWGCPHLHETTPFGFLHRTTTNKDMLHNVGGLGRVKVAVCLLNYHANAG